MEEDEKTGSTSSTLDFSAFEESLLTKLNDRFNGIQGLIDKKVAPIAKELAELKTANLSPEEQEQLETRREQEEVEQLRRENALLKLRRQYPDEVDFLEQFFGAKSLEDQIALMSTFRQQKAEAEVPEEETEDEPTPVDGNNPKRRTKAALNDGGAMTAERADAILASADQPGMLRKVRDFLSGER